MGVPVCRAVVPVAEKRADHHEAVTPGGADGGVNRVLVRYANGDTFIPPHLSKDQDIQIREDDTITVSTPGGGGFGDPRMRDPALIERDLRRGYYTADEIAEKFGAP